MKAIRLILYVGLGIFAVGVFVRHGSSFLPAPELAEQQISYATVESAADFRPLEKEAPRVDVCIEADVVEVKTPVQPLEERSDDVLFEIDALGGMPFDQAITMPFD